LEEFGDLDGRGKSIRIFGPQRIAWQAAFSAAALVGEVPLPG